jgi:hypothetical protein
MITLYGQFTVSQNNFSHNFEFNKNQSGGNTLLIERCILAKRIRIWVEIQGAISLFKSGGD